jgi:glycosyltransferase involved in cell wall biosynthesis
VPLRIAFLNSWPEPSHEGSGTAVSIGNLAQGLSHRGHEVVTLTPWKEGGRTPGPLPLLFHRLHFNRSVGRRIDDTGPFDLVVGFDMDGFLWSRRREARNSGNGRKPPPFILWLKGIASDEARFARGTDSLILSLAARLESMNARGADRVIVPSRYSAEVAEEVYGLERGHLHVVPEAIDLEAWERTPSVPRPSPPTRPSEAHPFRILSVARQYPRKDTETLLRALPFVRRAGVPVRLTIVGGGPELPRLRKVTRTLGLSDVVSLTGPLEERESLLDLYREADLFCLPSLQEGFGIVFLEAMAAGLPIVAARAGATPEVVTDGVIGQLVPPGDIEELGRALGELALNPALRMRMGEAGIRRVEGYSLDRHTDRFLEAATDSGAMA